MKRKPFLCPNLFPLLIPDNGPGTDYTSLSAWNAAVQSNLTTVEVIDGNMTKGSIDDTATITQTSSNATATVVHATATQMLADVTGGTPNATDTWYPSGGCTLNCFTPTAAPVTGVIAVAKLRSTDGTADIAAVDIDGWTTSATNYIKIWTDPTEGYRHDGTWGSGYMRTSYLTVSENYVRIDGISIRQAGTGYTETSIYVNGFSGAGAIDISNSYIEDSNTGSVDIGAISVFDIGATTLRIWNTIAVGNSTHSDARTVYLSDTDSTFYVYNVTAINKGSQKAFNLNAGTGTCTNCLGYSNSTPVFYADNAGWSSVTYSASSDDTADDWSGAGSQIDQTFTFVDSNNDDYHLDVTDTGALGKGTDLSTDANLAIYDDIDGQPRSNVWNIGADDESIWYNSSWLYRKKIIIDADEVDANLTNFPVLVNVTDNDLSDKAQSDADDILFTSGNGTTKLSHEIESFTSGTGEFVAWVKVPTLSSTQNTVLYMYYGNATAANQEDYENVWDSNYALVYHMSENPNSTSDGDCGGGTKEICDSTSNNNDGDDALLDTADQVDGPINGNINFDVGSGIEAISVADSTSLDMPNSFTIGVWFSVDSQPADNHSREIIGKTTDMIADTSGTQINYILTYDRGLGGGSPYTLGFTFENSSHTKYDLAYDTTLTLGETYYVVAVFDNPANDQFIYVNGAEADSNLSVFGTPYTNSADVGIGISNVGNPSTSIEEDFDGEIDEVRISNIPRSADWIAAEYSNQSAPSEFMKYESEETVPNPAAWYNDAWPYRKKIILQSSLVDGDQTDFPVLISTTDTDLSSYAQADHDDILFTAIDNTTKLSHEVELYTTGTGELVAWVKIPELSSTANTAIFMYYGNAAATNQEDVADGTNDVWNTTYKGVWHLSEDPGVAGAGEIMDATSNSNDGTDNGSMDTNDDVPGKIGVALNFDGGNDYINIPAHSTLNIVGDATMELWFKPDVTFNSSTATADNIFAKYSDDNNVFGLTLLGANDSTGGVEGTMDFAISESGNVRQWVSSQNSWTGGTWYHIVAVLDASNNANNLVYVDGADDTWIDDGTGTTSDLSFSTNWRIGGDSVGFVSGVRWFDGDVDEVRVSTGIRTASWIKTEYNNQVAPEAFANFGAQQEKPWHDDGWGYRKKITIESSEVDADLTDYPALITWATDSNLSAAALSSGDDIMFTADDGATKLSHEIELYTTGTGKLVAWVKIPSLSSTLIP